MMGELAPISLTMNEMEKILHPSVKDAVIAGIIASLTYSLVAQPVIVALYGADKFFLPFRQIAAVAVGQAALAPEYDVVTATALGTAVHLVIGIGYALVFWAIANALSLRSRTNLVSAGALYGVLIYAMNLFLIFPRWFPWFLENDPLLQVTLHALPFGAVIGWWLSRRRRLIGSPALV